MVVGGMPPILSQLNRGLRALGSIFFPYNPFFKIIKLKTDSFPKNKQEPHYLIFFAGLGGMIGYKIGSDLNEEFANYHVQVEKLERRKAIYETRKSLEN